MLNRYQIVIAIRQPQDVRVFWEGEVPAEPDGRDFHGTFGSVGASSSRFQ